VRWLELLDLAERLGSGASLYPDDRDDRITMVGLINEIAGENGFAWDARLIMFETWYASMGDAAEKNPMFRDYRYDPERVGEVRSTTRDFLDFQRWNRTTDTGIFRLIGLPWRIVRRHRIFVLDKIL
jgi:hypothetical protein